MLAKQAACPEISQEKEEPRLVRAASRVVQGER